MSGTAPQPNLTDEMTMQRLRMVERLRDHYKIADERVLAIMEQLPRHLFVPEALKSQAYSDNALPISAGQTISQPYIVARMTELLELQGNEKVLEIGSGSGYQTAVLASLTRRVFAIERLVNLAAEAETRLQSLGLTNVNLKVADGTAGCATYKAVRCHSRRRGRPDSTGTSHRATKDRRPPRRACRRGPTSAESDTRNACGGRF